MVDDLKSLKDNLFKVLAGRGQSGEDLDDDDSSDESDEGSFIDSSAARAVISTIFARAGKSKDEVVQILAREIGMAVAGMLKQPLSELAKHQKLQITFEFVPKKKNNEHGGDTKEEEEEAKHDEQRAPRRRSLTKEQPARTKTRSRIRAKK